MLKLMQKRIGGKKREIGGFLFYSRAKTCAGYRGPIVVKKAYFIRCWHTNKVIITEECVKLVQVEMMGHKIMTSILATKV